MPYIISCQNICVLPATLKNEENAHPIIIDHQYTQTIVLNSNSIVNGETSV
jgi:hypothetical protein